MPTNNNQVPQDRIPDDISIMESEIAELHETANKYGASEVEWRELEVKEARLFGRQLGLGMVEKAREALRNLK